MSDFKLLRGRRILVTKPDRKESSIELSDETKAALDAEDMLRWTKLEVYAIGEDVEDVVPGDKVYIPTYSLQQSEIVSVGGALRMMVSEADIAIIWE
jgi:hypothetical protein